MFVVAAHKVIRLEEKTAWRSAGISVESAYVVGTIKIVSTAAGDPSGIWHECSWSHDFVPIMEPCKGVDVRVVFTLFPLRLGRCR